MEITAPSRNQLSDVQDSHRRIEIPALGRRVELGMLYDRRNDILVTDKKLSGRYIESVSIKAENSDPIVTIIEAPADNLIARTQALSISNSLATSIFLGLVKVSGAAEYINDKNVSDNQARVILHLMSTVKRKELRADTTLAPNDCNFFEHGTHLVTGVTYGIQAFFVFRQQPLENKLKSLVQSKLVETISKLETCIKAEGSKILPIAHNKEYCEIQCQFYGDISSMEAMPKNFIEALECSTQLMSKKKEKAVLLSFVLKPWSAFDSHGPVFISLNSDTHTIIRETLQGLAFIEIKCKDLLKDSLWTDFSRFVKTLESFLDNVLTFKQVCRQRLARDVPEVRSASKDEQTLTKYLSSIKESPFYFRKLSRWVDYIDKAMKAVKSSLKELMPINIVSSLDNLQNLSNSNGNVVCFCFPSVYQHKKHLREMSRFLEQQHFDSVLSEIQHSENIEYVNYFESHEIATCTLHFKQFMEANSSYGQVKFVVLGFDHADANDQESINRPEIRLYQEGVLKPFALPGSPGKPVIEYKTHDSVTLKWTPPDVGSVYVRAYSVKYKEEYFGDHDWLTSSVSKEKTTTTIQNLEPHKTYRFVIVADCGVGLSASSQPSDKCTTLPSSAPLDVKKAKISFNSLQVGWDRPKQISKELSISHYKIKYHPAAEPHELHYKETDGGSCMHTLDGLTPNTSYNIFVCAVFNKVFESAFSLKVCIETESEEPPVPGVPIVTIKFHNEVCLQWTQPVWESACIKRYALKCRKTTGDWVDCYTADEKTCFKLSGLKPNTSYKFRICTDYGTRTSKLSASSEECTTYAATAPTDLKIGILFTDIMKIEWNPPNYKYVDIKRYKIKYQPAREPDERQLQEEETKGAVCFFTLRNLEPSTTYNISVSALCGDNGESAPAEIKADTAAENPPAPGTPVITCKTNDKVRLEWSKPGSDKHHIQGYVLHYLEISANNDRWKEQITRDQNTSSALTGLSPNTTYQFKVAADYGVCTGEMSGTSKRCTTYAATCPANLRPKMLFRKCMQIEWKPPSFVCKGYSVSKYRVRYYPATDRDDSHAMQEETQGATCIHTLRNLKPSTHYKISLTALLNNNGESAPSDFTKIGTASKNPPAPSKPGILSKTYNSVSLTWDEPAEHTYNIANYVVNYREKAPTPSIWRKFKCAGKGTTVNVTGLTANTTYEFSVAVDYGICSEISAPNEDFITDTNTSEISPSSEECTTHAATAPTNLKIGMLFTDIMKIEWNPPNYTFVEIQKYEIKYQPAREPDKRHLREEETKDIVCSYTLRNLEPLTTYKISVSALCGDNGESAPAEIELGTAAENPSAPGTPVITSKTHDEVRLEWSKPETDKHHIEGYVLHYLEISANNDRWKKRETRDQNTSFALTGLSPNTAYQFKVAADYGVCSGEMSGASKMCTTYVATCRAYLRPTIRFRELIQVEWNPITSKCEGYSVSKYRVRYSTTADRDKTHVMQEETEDATCIHTLQNLKPCTCYKISLTALFNNDGEGAPSDFINMDTASKNPPAPSKPDIFSKTHESVRLTWDKPPGDMYNTVITNYMVNYRERTPTTSNWKVYKSEVKCTTMTTAEVTGLTANTTYEFSVAADYGICTGDMSAPSEECTTDAISPPSDVMLTISFREIMQIEWKSPSFISEGHFVKKYKVKYQPVVATDKTQYKVVETEGVGCLYTLENLSPDTKYKTSVSALCEDGRESAPSRVCEIATAHTNPPAPEPPELDEKTHHTICLKWTHDINDATHIKSYVLTYKEASGDSWETFNTADRKKTANIPGLKPNTAYEFSVFADYGICEGDRSAPCGPYITYAASSPSDVRMHQAYQRKIEVVWNLPTFVYEGLFVKRYKIRCQPAHHDGVVIMKKSTDTECFYGIDDLLPNTAYLVSVAAVCSEDGESAFSTVVEIKTLPRIATQLFDKIKENTMQKMTSVGGLLRVELPLTSSDTTSGDNYRTYYFGDKVSRGKKHIVIMVVGATGAGKSTLITVMVNYIFQVTWEDDFRFHIITHEGKNAEKGQAESQTQLIASYTLYPPEGANLNFTLTIIDTPGFGDTRGIHRDKAIVNQIRDFFSDVAQRKHGVDHVNAIGFVAQAFQPRLTATQRYVFDSILGMFGRDMKQNIVLLVTFADGQKPQVMEAIKEAEIPSSEIFFKFNNSAIYAEKGKREAVDFDKMFWHLVMENMKNFFKALDEIPTCSLTLTKEVLKIRESLEVTIEALQQKMKARCHKSEELRGEQQILERHKAEIEKNKNFEYELMVHKSRLVDLKSGQSVLNCMNCHVTCHFPCYITNDDEKHRCDAMNADGTCKVCDKHCKWSDHRNQPVGYVFFSEKETRKYPELEKKYKEAYTDKITVEQLIRKHEEELLDVQAWVFKLKSEAHANLLRLNEIALRVNPLSTAEYVDSLISDEKLDARDGWQTRIEALDNVRKGTLLMEELQTCNRNPLKENEDNKMRLNNARDLQEKAQIARSFLQDHEIESDSDEDEENEDLVRKKRRWNEFRGWISNKWPGQSSSK